MENPDGTSGLIVSHLRDLVFGRFQFKEDVGDALAKAENVERLLDAASFAHDDSAFLVVFHEPLGDFLQEADSDRRQKITCMP